MTPPEGKGLGAPGTEAFVRSWCVLHSEAIDKSQPGAAVFLYDSENMLSIHYLVFGDKESEEVEEHPLALPLVPIAEPTVGAARAGKQ